MHHVGALRVSAMVPTIKRPRAPETGLLHAHTERERRKERKKPRRALCGEWRRGGGR